MKPADPKGGVWPTPDWLFAPLERRHRFELDAAADQHNTKCRTFFSKKDDALSREWRCTTFWCNPPYGTRPGTDVWVAHARRQVELGHAKRGCLLVPTKPETAWYQDLVWGECRVTASRKVLDAPLAGRWYRLAEPLWPVEVLELRGRVSFGGGNGFFGSTLVFFNAPVKPALLLGGTT